MPRTSSNQESTRSCTVRRAAARAIRRALGLGSLSLCGCQEDSTGPTPERRAVVADVAEGSRLRRADYPINVYDAASASITDPATLRSILYLIGGKPKTFGGTGNASDAVKAYDVSANTWRPRAPYPVRVRATNGAVEINGKIYVSGGFTRRWDEQRGVWQLETLRSLYVYDPATDKVGPAA